MKNTKMREIHARRQNDAKGFSRDQSGVRGRKQKTRDGSTEWAGFGGESFLWNVFSSIQDGISILDLDMNIIRVNPTMERWYHHAMPLVGRKCYEAYHGRNEPCEICPTVRAIETEQASYDIVGKRDSNGKVVGWLDLFSFPLVDVNSGKIRGIIEYVRDITDQKRAEDALRESEERFRALTESTSDWIWETDSGDVYTYASPKVKDLLGYDTADIIGKTPCEFMPPDEAERVAAIFHSIKEARAPIRAMEIKNLHRNGRKVILERSGVPFFDSKGNLRGYRGIDRDVSDRRRAEEILRGKESELQKRLKELETFYDIAVGRELRMIELKKEISKLKAELDRRSD